MIVKTAKMYFRKIKNGIIKKSIGQATLEFVMVIPFVIIVILAASQIGLIVYNRMVMQQASRECVRIISTTNNNSRGEEIVRRIAGENVSICIEPDKPALRELGDMVTVKVLKHPGGIFKAISEITEREFLLKAEASMRMECD